MSFRKTSSTPDIDLPTFIDVVFLLLIFFLVTYSPVPPKTGEEELDLNLPVAEGSSQVNENEPLETMLIEIMPLKEMEDQEPGFRLMVLLPFESFTRSQRDGLTYREARDFSIQQQRVAVLPVDVSTLSEREFSRLPAIQLLDDQIDRYVRTKFRVPRPSNRIDIRADESVQFRLIGFIMEKCSSFEDLIPSMIFRTKFKVQ